MAEIRLREYDYGGQGGVGALSLSLIALVRDTGRASNERSGYGDTLALCARLIALFCSDPGVLIPENKRKSQKFSLLTFHFPLK